MKEFEALRTELQEGIEDLTESPMLMPPNILILRRQTVRQYPGGLMVALYFNEKLNQYFSIPYGVPGVDSTITPSVVKEDAKEDAAIKALIDKPARTEEEQKEYEHQKDLARFRQRNARSSRGGASAGLQRSQHSRGHLNEEPQVFQNGKWVQDFKNHVYRAAPDLRGQIDWEHVDRLHAKGHTPKTAARHYVGPRKLSEDNTIIKPEELFHQPKNSKYRVGDKVSYTMASGNQHKRGKIVQVGVNHVVVHRKEPGGGKYGYHYRVPHDAIVHHERMGESVELNEISIPVAKKAYHTRQNRGVDAMNKGDYKTALPQFHKALKTQRLLSKKYEREDKGETVKEEVIQEDAISHLKKVVAFKTSTPLYHKDGTQTKIDPQTANALLTVHAALHPDNKQKFADSLEHSKPQFAKMLDFAWKQVK